jgi:hypothetical protein
VKRKYGLDLPRHTSREVWSKVRAALREDSKPDEGKGDSMKQQAIKRANKEIRQYQESIELLRTLPDGPFDFSVNIHVNGNTVFITLPFDLEMYRTYRRAMGPGWRCGEFSQTDHGNFISKNRTYWPASRKRHQGSTILLSLDTSVVGSTCSIRQIDVKKVPVYEVVCQ